MGKDCFLSKRIGWRMSSSNPTARGFLLFFRMYFSKYIKRVVFGVLILVSLITAFEATNFLLGIFIMIVLWAACYGVYRISPKFWKEIFGVQSDDYYSDSVVAPEGTEPYAPPPSVGEKPYVFPGFHWHKDNTLDAQNMKNALSEKEHNEFIRITNMLRDDI
jgi:hypothetical protein